MDCPPESKIHSLSQVEVLWIFNEALTNAGAGPKEGKIRSVERLRNKGLIGKFNQDEGARWFRTTSNADKFFEALGEMGNGASLKPRSHNVIVYFAPLTFNPEDGQDIVESNPILGGGGLVKARWAKPPHR
jgi:hypothetical protein